MKRIGSLLMLVCGLSLVIGCGGGGGGDGGGAPGMTPITDEYAAQMAVEIVSHSIDTVLEILADGTYTNEVVYGVSGTASVAGEKYYYSSGGVYYHDAALTIVFTAYAPPRLDNADATISGTVTFTDDTWSDLEARLEEA